LSSGGRPRGGQPTSRSNKTSCSVAIALNVTIAGVAWWLSRDAHPLPPTKQKKAAAREASVVGWLPVAAFISGFAALGLEVLWTRMFSQVLQNSVYTYSTILALFLAALGTGSFVANRLCRLDATPQNVLSVLLALAGVGAAATPFLFFHETDGMRYLASGEDFNTYVASIFTGAFLVLFVPGVLVGSVFPYMLRVAERISKSPGAVLGRLAAINTMGAIIGSLAAGFVLLRSIGLWGSFRVLAVLYLLMALLVADVRSSRAWVLRALPVAGVLLLVTALDATRLPSVLLNPDRNEILLDVWEGHHGVISVVEREGGLRIKVNNYYSLGGSKAMSHEQNQALIPLMTHPNPRSVFFLGMGTGITAGAALRLPIEHVSICELVPEVITASEKHFEPYTGGLFTDSRARVNACDGRNHLLGTDETYDVVIADLFIPWRAGVGNLYTREHFDAVKKRLEPGGLFVQWIPLFQVTSNEFFTIARTFVDVYPNVVLWRGDFFPTKPIVALVGSADPLQLSASALTRAGRHLSGGRVPDEAFKAVTLPFYVGNLGEARKLLPDGPINADDRPIVEYLAPISHRRARSGSASWFHLEELVDFYDALWRVVPPEDDPYLAELEPEERDYVRAGLSYYKATVLKELGSTTAAEMFLREFTALLPIDFLPDTDEDDVATEFDP
jgi:spermidine synthase